MWFERIIFLIFSGHTFFMSFTSPRTLKTEMNEKKTADFKSAVAHIWKKNLIRKKFVQSDGFCPGTIRGTFMPLESL